MLTRYLIQLTDPEKLRIINIDRQTFKQCNIQTFKQFIIKLSSEDIKLVQLSWTRSHQMPSAGGYATNSCILHVAEMVVLLTSINNTTSALMQLNSLPKESHQKHSINSIVTYVSSIAAATTTSSPPLRLQVELQRVPRR